MKKSSLKIILSIIVFSMYVPNMAAGAVSVEFASPGSGNWEGNLKVIAKVNLSEASDETVFVNYAATGGTATYGVDYIIYPGTLEFAPGQTSKEIYIYIGDDLYGEADETIIVSLSDPLNAVLGYNDTYTFTIVNADWTGFEFYDTASSGSESVTTASIRVGYFALFSGETTKTVDYSVTGGTATGGGVDYILDSGTLTFPPGTSYRDINISIINDSIDEPNETIVITLSNPDPNTMGLHSTHTYTILNDDDSTGPYIYGQFPEPNATQVERDSFISLHVADALSGVDANKVKVQLDGYVIYNGSLAEPNGTCFSAKGECRFFGSKATDYQMVFIPSTIFNYDQKVNVLVSAEDKAGNVMLNQGFSFYTVMRLFGQNVKVNSDSSSLVHDNPAAAMDSSGNIWVVWNTMKTATDSDIYIGKMAAGSRTFGSSSVVYSGPGLQTKPSIAISNNDTIYVAWQGQTSLNPWDIFVSSSTNGTSWSTPVVVNVTDPQNESNQMKPSIGIERAAPYTIYVAYQDYSAGNSDIWIASSTTGTSWTDTQITNNSSEQTDPVVGSPSTGGPVYILWTDTRNAAIGNGPDIYGATSPGWNEYKVVPGPGYDYEPVTASNGIQHVLWIKDTGSYSDVLYGNNSDGIPITGTSITDEPDIVVNDPTIAVDNSGRIFTAWTDKRNDTGNNDSDIYYAEKDSQFGTNVLINDDIGTSVQSSPVINVDVNSNPFIVWADGRNGNMDIYYTGTSYLNDPMHTDSLVYGDSLIIKTSNNIQISIPMSAFPNGFAVSDITISRLSNPPRLPSDAFGECYNFGPGGLQFSYYATITIPHAAADVPDYGEYHAYWYDTETGTWSQEGITDVQHHVLSETVHTVTFRTMHLTSFIIGGSAASGSSSDDSSVTSGGCAMSPYPGSKHSAGGFFLPFIVYVLILLKMTHSIKHKQKAKNNR